MELSVFVDESGDFGEYDHHAPYYIISLVFHNQSESSALLVGKSFQRQLQNNSLLCKYFHCSWLFCIFDKSENEIKIRREHKERPQGVVADRSVLDGVERNPPRKRKNSQFFPLASRRGTGCGAGPTSKFYVNLENEYKKVIEPLKQFVQKN